MPTRTGSLRSASPDVSGHPHPGRGSTAPRRPKDRCTSDGQPDIASAPAGHAVGCWRDAMRALFHLAWNADRRLCQDRAREPGDDLQTPASKNRAPGRSRRQGSRQRQGQGPAGTSFWERLTSEECRLMAQDLVLLLEFGAHLRWRARHRGTVLRVPALTSRLFPSRMVRDAWPSATWYADLLRMETLRGFIKPRCSK
jgi:hypothetical protein